MREIWVIEPMIFQDTAKLRVCAYARVSSDSEDQKNSFASQVNYYTKYIQAHDDWTFVDIYADQGITGTSARKRDEFLRLMRDCRQGKIDRILVKSVSRFARKAQDCIEAVRELCQLGVTVYFEKEHINTTSMSNEMFLSMMSAFAQEESISISKNMRKGAVMRIKNGTFRLSKAPYGYHLDEDGILIVQQEEAKIVQRIFGDFLSGMGIQEIAAELQKEHIPKLNGKAIWSYTGILYILTNERYIGDELFQKRFTTDTLPFQKKINRGQKKQYYAEDTHEPIISREVFQKAQELLKRKSERHGHQNNGQYPFTGLIVCDECGTNFCRRIAKNQRVLWTCRKHFKGKQLCSMESLHETEIQQCFLTLYKKLTENRKEILGVYLRQLEELKDKDFMAHPDAMELNRQIAGLLEQNHTLHRLRAKECVDSAFFIAQSNELGQKISNLKAELKQYRDLNEYAELIDNTRLILTIVGSPMPFFIPSVFRNIVSRITVTHETLRFQLVNGFERRCQDAKDCYEGFVAKIQRKTIAEVKDTPFSNQQGETANAPVNNAGDQMLSGMKTSVKKGGNLTYRGGKKLAQTTARKIQEKREVSRSLSEIKSTNRKVISESKNIGSKTTQSIQKTAPDFGSKNSASKVIKGKPQKAVKTVNRSVKGVKQGAKSIKNAQRSAKAVQKTASTTAKAAQKTAQAAKAAGRITAAGVKTAVRATFAAVKATIAASKGLIAAIAAGGWVVVVIVLLICMIGMAVGSIFRIFAPSPGSGNTNTLQTVMEEINQQYQDKLANIRENAVYNEVDLRGSPVPWKDVLAVYTVKNNTDPDQPPSFIEMDDAAKKELSEVFWDMTEVTHTTKQQEVQEIEVSDDGNGNLTETKTTVTKTFLIITVKNKTPESLSEVYGFSDKQKEYLSELLSPSFDSFWKEILTNTPSSSTDLVEIAQSQLGNTGGEPYWSWYGFDSRVEWCACFISWCADQAGMLENGELPKFASCNSQGVPWFQERGRWKDRSYTPSPGDIIFFDWDSDQKADHVGIVEKVENGMIYTIEGNSNDACQRNSYPVEGEIILGFGK